MITYGTSLNTVSCAKPLVHGSWLYTGHCEQTTCGVHRQWFIDWFSSNQNPCEQWMKQLASHNCILYTECMCTLHHQHLFANVFFIHSLKLMCLKCGRIFMWGAYTRTGAYKWCGHSHTHNAGSMCNALSLFTVSPYCDCVLYLPYHKL